MRVGICASAKQSLLFLHPENERTDNMQPACSHTSAREPISSQYSSGRRDTAVSGMQALGLLALSESLSGAVLLPVTSSSPISCEAAGAQMWVRHQRRAEVHHEVHVYWWWCQNGFTFALNLWEYKLTSSNCMSETCDLKYIIELCHCLLLLNKTALVVQKTHPKLVIKWGTPQKLFMKFTSAL